MHLYFHRLNSCPHCFPNNIKKKTFSFNIAPFFAVYAAVYTKYQVFGATNATDSDLMMIGNLSPSVTSFPHSGNDGASSILPGQWLHSQIEMKGWRAKRVETRHKVHIQITFFTKVWGKRIGSGLIFKTQIALIISKSIGTCIEPRHNRKQMIACQEFIFDID